MKTPLTPLNFCNSLNERQITDALIDPFCLFNRQGPVWAQIGVIEGHSAAENRSLTIWSTKLSELI
jgi:hypothetical protein